MTFHRSFIKLFCMVCSLACVLQCTTARNLAQPLLASGETLIETDIPYRTDSQNPRHRLDLFRPKNTPQPRGLVVFIHGGFWKNQDRRYYRPLTGLYWNVGYALARNGYAVAVLSYRIYPEVTIGGELEDVQAALGWAASQLKALNIEENRLFVMGHSAGGHLATLAAVMAQADALAGKNPPIPLAGVIALSPILDVAQMRKSQPPEFNQDVTDRVFQLDVQADEAEISRALAPFSPGPRWDATAPPLLVLTAAKDYPFIRTQAAAFADEHAGARKHPIVVREIAGLDHAGMVLEFDARPSPLLPVILEFLAALDMAHAVGADL